MALMPQENLQTHNRFVLVVLTGPGHLVWKHLMVSLDLCGSDSNSWRNVGRPFRVP